MNHQKLTGIAAILGSVLFVVVSFALAESPPRILRMGTFCGTSGQQTSFTDQDSTNSFTTRDKYIYCVVKVKISPSESSGGSSLYGTPSNTQDSAKHSAILRWYKPSNELYAQQDFKDLREGKTLSLSGHIYISSGIPTGRWRVVFSFDHGTPSKALFFTISVSNESPQARFTFSPENPDTSSGVSFNGSSSSDSDGTIRTFKWNFGDGSTGEGKYVTHHFNSPGTFTVTLTVTDDDAGANSTSQQITVSGEPAQVSPNSPPEAHFSYGPTVVTVGESIWVDASSSFDPDGTISDYAWNFGDGTSEVGRDASHTYNRSGAFAVTLTVTDDDGATGSTSQQITVQERNEPPVARFSWDVLSAEGTRLLVQPHTSDRVRFDASASYDPDGGIVRYEWDWDGDNTFDENTTASIIEHTFSSFGKYQVALRVTDNEEESDEIAKMVPIEEYGPPQAGFSFSPAEPSILDEVQFTDRSNDADGEVVAWQWEFGDGKTSTERHPTHTYGSKGTFNVRLTVTDNDELTDTLTNRLPVLNLRPEPSFTFVPEGPSAGQQMSFDASPSHDLDGKIVSFSWDFDGDGEDDAEGTIVTWSFVEAGTYTVTLTVMDGDGETGTHNEDIIVSSIPVPVRFEDQWAMVVGIGDYKDPTIDDLLYTEVDATAFYNYLIHPEGGGFAKDHVKFYLGSDATRKALMGAKGFTWLVNNADENDLVIIYYSGHGAFGPDYSGDEDDGMDEYLVPSDTISSNLDGSAIRDDEIGEKLHSMRCKNVLIVLDSCFSGGATKLVRGFNQPGMKAAPGNIVFTDLLGDGSLVLAASRENQPSYENPALSHGVFTYFLLLGLGASVDPESPNSMLPPAADTDGDGQIMIAELSAYLASKVPDHVRTKMNMPSQNPIMIGAQNLTRGVISGYGKPMLGEVVSLQGEYVIVSLGTADGVQPGDRFEVVRVYPPLPDGQVYKEVRATIEVVSIIGPNRSACRVWELHIPIGVNDQVRPIEID